MIPLGKNCLLYELFVPYILSNKSCHMYVIILWDNVPRPEKYSSVSLYIHIYIYIYIYICTSTMEKKQSWSQARGGGGGTWVLNGYPPRAEAVNVRN